MFFLLKRDLKAVGRNDSLCLYSYNTDDWGVSVEAGTLVVLECDVLSCGWALDLKLDRELRIVGTGLLAFVTHLNLLYFY